VEYSSLSRAGLRRPPTVMSCDTWSLREFRASSDLEWHSGGRRFDPVQLHLGQLSLAQSILPKAFPLSISCLTQSSNVPSSMRAPDCRSGARPLQQSTILRCAGPEQVTQIDLRPSVDQTEARNGLESWQVKLRIPHYAPKSPSTWSVQNS